VLAFMAVYYRLAGIIADFALLLNVMLLIGALAAFNATLTLPGIAGIILTIGMAVDSNVLIFERIREELRQQRPVRLAIDAGYDKAFVTIIDSHVTTLITAVVLFLLGTGPIKGFAVTLSLGVTINLFTSIVGTRVIFDWLSGRHKLERLSI
jgi:preprotein translocase subunit SecD